MFLIPTYGSRVPPSNHISPHTQQRFAAVQAAITGGFGLQPRPSSEPIDLSVDDPLVGDHDPILALQEPLAPGAVQDDRLQVAIRELQLEWSRRRV